MTPLMEWMLRAIALAALVGIASWSLEEALRGWQRATRFVWVGAGALSIALPLLALFAPDVWPEVLKRAGGIIILPAATTATVTSAGGIMPSSAWSARDVLLALWAMATLICATRWLHGWLRIARERAGWRAAVLAGQPVYISDQLGPAVVGLQKPRVVLPAWLLLTDPDRLQMIVRHEVEHTRAGDQWLLALAPLAVVLFPWNVALWWQLRRLRLAIELDCDARVLRAGVPALEYGSMLLDVASGTAGAQPVLAALSEPRSFLERRIRAMTPSHYQHALARATGLLSLTLTGLVAAIFAAAPMARPVVAQMPPPPPPAPPRMVSTEPPPPPPPAPPVSYRQQQQQGDPLFVVDGKILGPRAKLDAVVGKLSIATVEVLKPAAAMRRFGERARYGAVLVTTRDPDDLPPELIKKAVDAALVEAEMKKRERAVMDEKLVDKTLIKERAALEKVRALTDTLIQAEDLKLRLRELANNPIVFLDGILIEFAGMRSLDPATIEHIEIVKGAAAVEKFGERARAGAIFITTKR